ncbi:TPA: Holliday junction resolvase RuvX [Candidatus Sumerlaeota bacterium]|jgi:putative holliday junction resolvase|nr:Holliday junction resolvase RuvX [Candidatus Sumerlaeota bacterium]
MARMLSLDIGDRRIGVAAGSPETGLARPLETLVRTNKDDGHIFQRLRELVKSEEAEIIVVGDPVNMDGSVGPRAEISREFAARVKKAIRQAQVVLYDERLSSFSADEWMERDGIRKADRKGKRDAYAAAVILLDYLEALRAES